MVVLTVDQRHSRTGPDRVPELLERLSDVPVVRAFQRTVGDELQAVLDDPAAAVDAVLRLARDQGWSTGIGVGPVREPLPDSSRQGAGRAREAVEAAKAAPSHLAVRATGEAAGREAEAVLRLLADVVARRTRAGWEVADLLAGGARQSSVAARLGVSRQAVSQRAAAAGWTHERDVAPVAASLLRRADGSGGAG